MVKRELIVNPARILSRCLTLHCLIQIEDNQISITDPADTGGNGKREPKVFSYDFAYDWTSSQEGVHLDLGSPIVEKALQGYNGTSSHGSTMNSVSKKLDNRELVAAYCRKLVRVGALLRQGEMSSTQGSW